jgi:hypothetical protein
LKRPLFDSTNKGIFKEAPPYVTQTLNISTEANMETHNEAANTAHKRTITLYQKEPTLVYGKLGNAYIIIKSINYVKMGTTFGIHTCETDKYL